MKIVSDPNSSTNSRSVHRRYRDVDAMLGKNYGVMLTIGLPGIVPKEGLQEHMDVVVDGLDDIQ